MNTGIITRLAQAARKTLRPGARPFALALAALALILAPPAARASTQPASIDCPGTQYYENDLGQCSAEVTLSDIVTVNGDSPLDITVTVNGTSIPSFSSPFAFLVGDNTVVIEASNGAGNDICTFTLSVSDVDGPIIDAPLSITLTNRLGQCFATIGGLSQITATDNCGTPTLSFSPYGVGDDVPVGTHTITVTAEDENGNTSSTDFQLVVLDLEAPEIVAPASITFTNTPGQCDAVVGSLAQVVVTDNCSLLNVTFSPYGEGSIVSVGSHTITVTAEDMDGNVEMDTFELIIVDGEAPTITCPANLSFVTTSPAGVEAMFTPTTADNCGVLDYTCTPASGSTFAPGTNRVTCVVTDINGNTNACGFDVAVLLVSGEPNALNFDGVDDRVDATLKHALFGSVSTTLEFWAKAAPNFAFPIVIEGNQHNVTWGTTLAFAEFFGSNFQTGYPLDDCWHHFAFTYDGSTGTMYAFVDGQPTPTPSHAGPWNVTGLTPSLTLGQRFDGTAYPWNGTLDELRIWNVQRTQAELQTGMFTELTGGEAGLVYYANFNQGVAGGDNTGVTTLVDLTANASHGTLSNFALSGGASDWVASGALRQYPEVDVKSGMVSIADGDTTPGISDGTDFGGVAMGTSVSHTFTIENTGPVVLNLTGVPDSVVVSGSTDFYVSAQPSTQVDSNGGTTTFTVQFAPNSPGLQTATISFTSDDCDEDPYEFTVSGTGVDVQSTAMDFDGVDAEVVVKDFSNLPVGNAARTIEFWAKVPAGFSSGTPVLWGNFSQLQGICAIMLLDAGGGQVTPYFRGHYADLPSNRTFPVETWAHVALTADGTTLRFYVNGVAGASDTISLDTVRTAFHLGRPVPGPETDWFKGQLDEVRIWNVARTEAEISAGMNTELAGNESGLVCYYKMDDAMQPGVDCAAHSNVGCVSGATIDVESPIISNAACTGGGGVPDGNVRGNGLDIAYGDLTPDAADGTDFGNTRVGSGSLAHSFSIQNTGAGALRVSSIASTDPQFAISGISLPTTIADGDSVTFDITLTPSATGAVTGTIQIVLPNDCDECDYEFAVTGVGVADEPPTITCPPNVLTNALVGEASAQVSWMVAAAGAPAPTVTCRVEGSEIISPHFFPLGASTVTCTASNAAGSANCSFTVTVNCTPTLVERAQQVADIWPGAEDSYPEDFIVFRGALYFTAEDELHGEELRRFDGTNVTLVRDLYPGSDGSYPYEITLWNDALYFQAVDGSHGTELFKFDGTNVTLAADIYPGSDDSNPYDFTVFNGALYFAAYEPVGGWELWRFDGANASRAADIWPGSDDSRPYGFTVFNGALYFPAYEPTAGNELWKFDGTNATLAADIYPSGDSSYPDRLTAGPDALYFIAEDGNTGREPWRFDGTNATLAADIEPGPGYSYAELLLSWNGALYFVAYSAAENYELWKLEGTNLTLVTDFNPGPDSSSAYNLTVSGNHLYFAAYPAGLYKYDGTNITALPGAEYPDDLVEFQGGIYFEGYRSDVGYELFRTDGTNVFLVADIKPGMNSSYPYDLTEFNGALYFGAENSLGKELWRLNQRLECVTNAAPTITCPGDLFVTTSPTACEGFVDFTNAVTGYPFPLFSCTVNGDPSYSFPTTLSVGDYTVVCTASNSFGVTNCSFNVTVRDFAPPVLVCPPDIAVACNFYVPAPSFDGGSSEDGCDGAITPVLTAETTNGISPKVISRTWTATDSSGNSNSCVQRITVRMDFGLAADVRPGSFGSDPEDFAVFNGALYFSAEDNTHGEELWKFDGTNATLAADIRPGGNSSYPEYLTVFNGALYFNAEDNAHGEELWKFDGTNATLAADIRPGDDDSYPEYLTVFNGALYFKARSDDYGDELWKFDGTDATLAADINPGDDDSYPEHLTVFNGALYFQANSDDYGYELWKFDGTNATLAADINPGDDDSYPAYFTVFNGALYFQAYENDHGEELWKFDGTNATLAADINPGGGDSDPRYLTVFNGALYFRAYTSDYGRELWKFDGTNATLAADINPGGGYSYPEYLTVFNGALYFSAEDYTYGTELWKFDGTNAPQVYDLRPGIDSSYPEELIVFQGALYFQASDNAHGDELWQLGRPGPACPTEGAPVLSCSNLVMMADAGRCIAYLDVRPFPNFFPAPEVICTVNGGMIYGGQDFGPGTNDVVCTATNIYGGDACSFTVTVIVPPEQFGVNEQVQIVTPATPEFCCNVVYPFEVSPYPAGIESQGKLYYSSSAGDGQGGLWTWDGTNAVRLAAVNQTGDANFHNFVELSNVLYFAGTDGLNGYQPHQYHPVNGASRFGFSPPPVPEFHTVFDGKVYFSGIVGGIGRQVWRYDGFIPAPITSLPGGSAHVVRDLAVFNGALHFVAGVATNAQLWRLDSTGAVQVTSISPGIDVTHSWVTVVGSTLYFAASDGAHGVELWKYDGTTAVRLTDVAFGPASANPSWITAFNGSLYFTAENPTMGAELWRFDGTNASPVADIRLGTDSSGPHSLTVFSNALYFAAIVSVYDFGFLEAEERLFRFDGEQLKIIRRDNMCRGKVLTGMTPYQGALYFRYSDDCYFQGAQQLARLTLNYECRDDGYPGLYCFGDLTIAAPPGECGAWFTVPLTEYGFPDPAVVCRSGATVFTVSHFFPVGVHPMTCTASNRYEVSDCSFTLTVAAPLEIVCPGDLLTNVSATATSAVVNFSVSASGECSPLLSTNCVPPSGSEFPPGTTTVTCTVSNAGGLTASCSFTVSVIPNQAPRFVCDVPVINLDGVDGRVRVPGFGLYAPTEEITIEFWQKMNGLGQQSTFTTDPDHLENRIGAHVPWDDGRVYWDFGDGYSDGRSYYDLNPAAIGTWQHFALVSSRSANQTRIYRNGLLEHQENHAGRFHRDNYTFFIGGLNNPFGGQLAELRVWQGARTGAEIHANYQRRLTGTESGLVAYYPLDESSDITAHDRSANNRNGALEGGAVWTLSDLPVGVCEPPPLLLSCLGDNPAAASFTNALTDADGHAITVVWFLDGTPVQTNDVAAGGPPSLGTVTLDATFSFGAHTVVVTATDSFGDSTSQTNLVNVIDMAAPTIACSSNLTVIAVPNATTAVANYTVTATDGCDANPAVVCQPLSGFAFPLGATTVNCLATDASGNTNGCSFTITICSPLITVVNTNDSGFGSLRWAIANVCPDGTIIFDTNGLFATPQTIGLTSGELVIAKGLHLVGPGTNILSVSGNQASRIFQINGNAANPITNTISGLTLRDGNGSGSVTNTLGGAIYSFGATLTLAHCTFSSNSAVFYGGGIYAKLGSVTLTHCTFSSNTAYTGGGIFGVSNRVTLTQCALSGNSATGFDAYGGGIYTEYSAVDLTDSVVSGNSAIGAGGVGFGSGGGICTIRGDLTMSNSGVTGNVAKLGGGGLYFSDNSGHSLTLTQCSITGNSAGDGGGISAFGGTATLTRCVVSDNSASYGGGISAFGSTATLTRCVVSDNSASYGGGIRGQALMLTTSTVSGNSAVEEGGGIHGSYVALTQCTVSGNRATNSIGGGIFSYDALLLTHCTVSGNSARYGGGIHVNSLGEFTNSIVAGNFAGTTPDDIFGNSYGISGAYNLIGDAATSGGITNGINGNIVGNAGVGTYPITSILDTNLADNGGPTLTHALVAGSPAINMGDTAAATNAGLTNDQRGFGFVRVFNGTVDIGAFEAQTLSPLLACVNLTTTNDPGQCSASVAFSTNASGFPVPVVVCIVSNMKISSPRTFPLGVSTVTCIATNASGTNQCSFTVTVRDAEPPAITCPMNFSVQCLADVPPCPTNLAQFLALGGTAGDNCDTNLAYTCSDGAFAGNTCGGTITRTHTVTDDYTNSASCLQIIRVIDTIPPVISCPTNFSVQCVADAPACPGNLAAFLAVGGSASDNCDTNLQYFCTDSALIGGVCGGTIIRTHTVVDDCTNTASCVQIITVRDTIPPVITCAPDRTNEWVTGSVPVFGDPTASDNCDTNLTITFADSELPANCPAVRVFRRTWTATDDCTNSASCSQIITFVDTTPPVIACVADRTNEWVTGSVPVFGEPTASDTCDTNLTITFIDTELPANCPAVRVVRRTWTATDDCTNSASCSQTITSIDTVAPSMSCPSSFSVVAAPGATSSNLTYAAATATDAGTTNPVVVCAPPSGSAFPLGLTTVTCVATDLGCNTNACTFTITICSPLITVVNTNDAGTGSLRWAISNLCDSGTITFAPALNGSTIGLTSGELVINKSLNLLGPGGTNLVVSGNQVSRVFHLAPSNDVAISGLTIARGNAGGGDGGGILNDHSDLVLSACVVSGNAGRYGGGIFNDGRDNGGFLTLSNCTVIGNHAAVNGGGLASYTSTNVIFGSTIASNVSASAGGGVYVEDAARSVFDPMPPEIYSTLRLVNSTISGNLATNLGSGDGGGVFYEFTQGEIRNTTFAGNASQPFAADGFYNHGGTIIVQNSIFVAGASGANLDGNGTITSLGYNLSSDGGGGFLTATGDLINTNAMLGPLAANGGPTLTHALLAGSPAINAGNSAFNTNSLAFDQRGPGFPRVLAGRLDIGTYETIDFDPFFGCEISRWRFDETNGVAALDSSGVNLGTLVNGPVRVPGRVGSGALQLDGVDDFVRIPNHPSLSLTTNWSLSMWFKPSQLLNAGSGRRDLFKKFASYWLLFNYPGNDGKLAFVFNTGSPIIKSTTSSWPANQWQHVAATYDGAMMRLYINGVLEASTPTNIFPNANTTPIEIGGSTEYRNFYPGCVDDVRIFCTNLSPATVMAIYDGSIILPPPPPPPTNTPPLISDIPNVTLITNASSLLMPFTVSDGQTPMSNLVVTAVSDNPTLLPNANIFLADYVSNRVVQVTPAPNQTGVATVTVTVTDGGGATNADTFTVSVTAPAPPTTGCLISHWNFNEASGNTAFDVADSNPGTLVGSPVRAPGLSGGALYFNGVDNYVNVPDSESLDLTNQFSISLWFQPNSLLDGNSGRRDLLQKFLSYWFIINYPANDGKLTFVLNSGAPVVKSTTASWPAGQWQHAVATYDGVSLKLYVNGVLEASAPASALPVKNTNPLLIGGNNIQGHYFPGGMDEVRVYGCALTAGDITGLYNQGGATNPPPPLNTPPTISDIASRTIAANSNTGDIPFTVNDAETSAGSLSVTATSTNTTLVPNANLVLGGSSGARTLRVTPAANLTGMTLITVTVSDGVFSTNDTFLLTVTNAPPPPPSGTNQLISRWQFDETGPTALDAFGSNPGTLVNGPSRVVGTIGSGALQFDGINDHVNVPDSSSLDLSNRFTIAFWFKPSVLLNGTSGRKDLLQKFLSYWILLNYPANDGKLAFILNSGSPLVKSTTASWNSNQWYHVAATYDGVTMRLYINGVLEGTALTTITPTVTANPLQLGGNTTQGHWFPGALDDVRLYGNPLSADAVSALHGGFSPLLPPGGLVTLSPALTIRTEPQNDLVVLQWAAQAGRSYRVEYTDDLATGEWTALPGHVSVSGSTARAEDTLGLSTQRFYRVVIEP